MQNGLANDTIGNSCKMTTVCRRVSKLLRYIQLPAFSATFSGKLNDKHLVREKNKNNQYLQCDYCNRCHLDKVDRSDCGKITIHTAARKKTISYSKHKI